MIPILNIISILPLVLVFWETLQLRYLKNRNPYILIGRIFTSQELIDEENNIFGFIFDIISLILEILYIISFLCYNSTPKFFEFLNLLILIIIPGLKFLLIFGCTFIVGLIIVGVRIINICKRDKINEEKYVEENINKIKSIDYSDEYEPVRLLMHKGNRKSLKCFYIKFIGSCLLFFFFLFFFIFLYWIGGFILYFFLFFIISVGISNAVPCCFSFNRLCKCCECCECCNSCECCINDDISNVDKKYKGLKYLFYFIIVLVNLILIFLMIKAFNVENFEYEEIEQRYDPKIQLLNNDFSEQKLSRDFIKSPMCFTSIHHLNFIQLVSLAQAAYSTKDDELNNVKDLLLNIVFKDSNAKIVNMTFLANKSNNPVLLKIDFEILNSHRKLTVFSIRGSTDGRDWWLDVEMYTPSFMLTFIKSIPLIQNDESLTSQGVKALLTMPINFMESITLLNYYSKNIINKIDKIIKDSQDTDFIFVGHSLGGGLSKYLAFHYKKISFSVSGPGVSPLEYMSLGSFNYDNNFRKNFIDVIPDHDIVPRLEISGGTKYRVLCNKDLGSCHSIARTFCMIGIMCQQEEYTKQMCLHHFGFTENEYAEMKELNNGKNFCENLKVNEKNKNICKTGDVTSKGQKCCYVHIKYLNNNEMKNEYKCLQFNENEKQEYFEILKNKYSYCDKEIECE